jgi:hypothetical protein
MGRWQFCPTTEESLKNALSAVQHTDKMAENRAKSQEAATLLRRAASILTQNSAESEGYCARNSNMGNTVRPIKFNLPQVNKPQPLVTMNFGDYSPCTIGLTITASFINLRRSAVEVILGDKRVLLSEMYEVNLDVKL